MAVIDEMETATRQHFMPVITNQIWKISPVLHRIFRPSQAGQWGLALPSFDGRSIAEPLEYGEVATQGPGTGSGTQNHGAYTTAVDWGAATEKVLTYANYVWKMYFVNIKIHNVDIEANKGGRERVFDIMAVKLRNAVQVLRKDLISDFFTASADTAANGLMVGLPAMCQADQTIGAIAQNLHSWWQGNKMTAEGDRDLTWLLLNEMYFKTKKYGAGDKATLIVGSEGLLQDYEDNLTKVAEATARPLIQLVKLATEGQKEIDGGFPSFSFKGIPMVADPFCTANALYFINEKYLHWRVLKNFDSSGWVQLRAQGKDYAQNSIFGYGALTSSCNSKFGLIEDLNEA